jgi:hypothetical protein
MSGTQAGDGLTVAEGSCAGTGGPAIDGSVLQEGATRKTGVCPLCGGRVRLGSGARLLDHTAAPPPEP